MHVFNIIVLKDNHRLGSNLGETEKKKIEDLRAYLTSSECTKRLEAIFPEGLTTFDPILEARRLEDLMSSGGNSAENIPPNIRQSLTVNAVISSNVRAQQTFRDVTVDLCDIQHNQYFNIAVKIIGFLELNKSNSFVIRCLDGTRVRQTLVKAESVYVLTDCSQMVVAQLNDYLVDVSVFDDHVDTAKKVNIGDCIKIQNVHCYTPSGFTTPELILHGGHKFCRGIYRLSSDDSVAKIIHNRLSGLEVAILNDVAEVLESFPDDEPRSLQTSPTVTDNSELEFTSVRDALSEIPHLDTPKLYKVRAFVDWYEPGNYPSMVTRCCQKCAFVNTTLTRRCMKCDSVSFNEFIFIELYIRDGSTKDKPVHCSVFGSHALKFFQISSEEVITLEVLEKTEHIVGKWCDLIVCGKVLDSNSTPQLILCHTRLKE